MKFDIQVMSAPRSEKTFSTAEEMVAGLWETAEEVIEGDGYHAPMMFSFTKDVMQAFDLTQPIQQDACDELADMIRQVAKNPEVEGIVMVHEIWYLDDLDGIDDMMLALAAKEAAKGELKDFPGRKEGIRVHGEMRNGTKHARWAEVTKDEYGNAKVGPQKDENVAEANQRGRFCNFFE